MCRHQNALHHNTKAANKSFEKILGTTETYNNYIHEEVTEHITFEECLLTFKTCNSISSLGVWDHVLYPREITDNITALYTLCHCCATFLHSRHTKYCRRVKAAHQPHFAYCREEMVYGTDWPRQLLINRPQPKNVLFDVHNYPSFLLCHLF
jgi:hypothetical protein